MLLPRQAWAKSFMSVRQTPGTLYLSFSWEVVVSMGPPESENKKVGFVFSLLVSLLCPSNTNTRMLDLCKNKYRATSYNPVGKWIWFRMWQFVIRHGLFLEYLQPKLLYWLISEFYFFFSLLPVIILATNGTGLASCFERCCLICPLRLCKRELLLQLSFTPWSWNSFWIWATSFQGDDRDGS